MTSTVKFPTVFEFTVSVEVAEPPAAITKLVGLNVAVAPEGDTELAIVSVPANPFMLDKVIVDDPELLTGKMILAGFGKIAKSVTLTMIVTVRVNDPDVPVTVIE